ncbi:hypothetical protein BV22DRAFT_970267, partial [Leucogyrophana mollusca]
SRSTPLNKHLHKIQRSDTPNCPICTDTVEDIHHFLFSCPQYACERHIMRRTLRRKATSLTYILTSEDALEPFLKFVNSTGRFKPTFGEV